MPDMDDLTCEQINGTPNPTKAIIIMLFPENTWDGTLP
jgi:hypothetical protein